MIHIKLTHKGNNTTYHSVDHNLTIEELKEHIHCFIPTAIRIQLYLINQDCYHCEEGHTYNDPNDGIYYTTCNRDHCTRKSNTVCPEPESIEDPYEYHYDYLIEYYDLDM